ncbi:Adaptive-response sensory-kinase SasA [subsurface metagenome]
MRLKTKFSLFASLLITMVLAATGLLFLTFEKQHLIKETRENQIALVKSLAGVGREALLRNYDLFLIDYIKIIKEGNKAVTYALFVDNENRILAHSNPQLLRQIVKDTIGIKAQSSQGLLIQSYQRVSEEPHQEIIDIALPVFLGKQKKGIARIGFSTTVLEEIIEGTLHETGKRVLGVALGVLIFGLLGAFILAATMTRPIKVLVKGADLIGQGKLDTKIKVERKDELGWLADEFNQMAERLKKLDQMKKDFLSGVTHDLRSPLAAIESYVNEMLEGGVEEFAKTGIEDLNTIKNNTIRLSRFINDLLDAAKIEGGRMEMEPRLIDLSSLVTDVTAIFMPKAEEEKIDLRVELPIDLPKVFADGDRIGQVLTNLISNGIKFTPPGGTVTINAEKMIENPEFVLVKVSDTGVGIPSKDLDSIFDKFHQGKDVFEYVYRNDRLPEDMDKALDKFHYIREVREKVKKGKGTGFGLFIVKSIVELHGGKIWAESKLGEGATFIFTLPVKSGKIKT